MAERAVGRTKLSPARALTPQVVLPALTAMTAAMYLGAASRLTTLGFPLDDSWIHQTIARNIARHGEYTFNLHQPMSGSTAPLWTLLLSTGHALPGGHMWFTYGLGIVVLLLTAVVVYRLTTALYPQQRTLALVASAFFVLEWRSGWSALSGMETSLFALLTCLAFLLYITGTHRESVWIWLSLGLVVGAATFVRPEGGILFLVLLGHWVWRAWRGSWRVGNRSLRPAVILGVFLLVTVAGYGVFNYILAGTPLPTTFYAKSQAYQPSLDLVATLRYLVAASWILILGPVIVLVPGLLYGVARVSNRLRSSAKGGVQPPAAGGGAGELDLALLPAVWIVALIVLYAVRLPVVYHHGRYLMPLIPLLCIYGLHGTAGILDSLKRAKMFKAEAVWRIVIVVAIVVLWVRGAGIYAEDVKLINDQQVQVANWIGYNTEPSAKIATHDIGAIGYFSGRTVVDTAGLVNRDAIAHLHEQDEILAFAKESGAGYLAMLPDWYPSLAVSLKPRLLYQAEADYVTEAGFQNMAVYYIADD